MLRGDQVGRLAGAVALMQFVGALSFQCLGHARPCALRHWPRWAHITAATLGLVGIPLWKNGARLLAAAALVTAGSAFAQTKVGGFYRQADRPEVYYQYAAGLNCHVQNETQMALFGGFDQVVVVPRLTMAGQFTGLCGWPNGFYRRANETAVYRLTSGGVAAKGGGDICHVDETQMAQQVGSSQVQIVPPTSDIARDRGKVGPCDAPPPSHLGKTCRSRTGRRPMSMSPLFPGAGCCARGRVWTLPR